jgi:hypothetical protein
VITPVALPWPFQRSFEAATRALFDPGGRSSIDFLRPAGEAALVSPDSVSWRARSGLSVSLMSRTPVSATSARLSTPTVPFIRSSRLSMKDPTMCTRSVGMRVRRSQRSSS